MNEDIFDKLFSIKLLKWFEPTYKKNKEVLLYLFFGGLTFIVSIITYWLFNVIFGMNELIANAISWIVAVTFAFFTNRIWVFNAPTSGKKDFISQAISFYSGRIVTLFIEEAILLLFITLLHFPSMIIKIIAQVIVIVLNYVISKLFVFS